ncbi:hypothetical protein JCM18750_35010 [Halostagnicola bangensis]
MTKVVQMVTDPLRECFAVDLEAVLESERTSISDNQEYLRGGDLVLRNYVAKSGERHEVRWLVANQRDDDDVGTRSSGRRRLNCPVVTVGSRPYSGPKYSAWVHS